MNGCQTCGGFGMHHDPIAHDQASDCQHEWMDFGGFDGSEWRECFLCGKQEDVS